MERVNEECPEALVELGTPSADTRGGMGDMIEAAGLWHKAGISDD